MGLRTITSLGAILACAGCSSLPGVSNAPKFPLTMDTVRVFEPVARFGYLEATLQEGDGPPLRFYFPDDPTCRALLQEGAQVEYGGTGTLGNVKGAAADGRCEPLGTSSLGPWHARTYTPRERLARTAVARFELMHEDDEVVWLRGRFPLGRVLGWSHDDLVAVLPSRPECRTIAARREATMTYYRRGDWLFDLRVGEARCEVIGMLQPQR